MEDSHRYGGVNSFKSIGNNAEVMHLGLTLILI